MSRSVSLAVYMLLSRFGERWLIRKLNAPNPERKGIASVARPDGPLLWINATNAQSADAILALSRKLLDQNPDLNCLVTTQSETTASAFKGHMPPRTILQYVPVDATAYINAFLNHWRPDLSVWTGAGFQPAFVVQTRKRNIPTVYIDALMSAKSFRRYRFFNKMCASLLQRFDQILTQDAPSKKHLQNLGAPADKIKVSGKLYSSTPPLPHDETQRKALARAIGGRAVWLAALTEESEEELILAAHRKARRSFPELLLILVPRDATRDDTIADNICGQEYTVAQRSKNQQLNRQTDIYLADTIDEMGLWYRLAPVTFLGGSLVAKGGQNPLNAAALGTAILHGPDVSNFKDSYKTLSAADACINVTDSTDLAAKLEITLAPERAAQLATAAWGAFDDESATDQVFDLLQSYFPKEAS